MSLNPTAAAKEREGSTLNAKYTINKLLGVGGMAAVYAATHRNKKRCALKILHTELSAKPEIRERFLREGYVANTVDHPGAVKVDDDDTSEDGSAYLVMELLEGQTLEGVASEAGGKLAPQLVLPLMDQLLAVLAAAHDKGIVHRDIKPENVFLHRSSQVKVLDFGIARLQEAEGSTRRTVEGAVMGTPAFMAPEQARGVWDEVDGQSDIWSVGASMFSMLSGEVVHTGSTINEALAASIIQPARPIRDLLPDLPPPIANVVDTALKRDKPERYKTANEMRQALNVAYREVYGVDLPQALPTLGGPGDYRESLTSNPSAPGLVGAAGAVQGTTSGGPQASLWNANGGGTTPPVTATHTSVHGARRPVLLAVALTVLGGIVLVGGAGLWSSMSSSRESEPTAPAKAALAEPLEANKPVARAPEPVIVPVTHPEAAPSTEPEATAAEEPKPSALAPTPRPTKPPARKPKPASPSPQTPKKPKATPEVAPPAKKFDPFASRD